MKREYQVCTNCVMDTSDSKIVFDENGVCDHCKNFNENIKPTWKTDEHGKAKLAAMCEQIKRNGKNREFDCLIGLSGGVDSSYLAWKAKEEWGLRPLVFTVDTGWNLPVAGENVRKIIDGCKLTEYHVTIEQDEMVNLQLAYFKSQVAYQDMPQDHAIFSSLYHFAAKEGFKYILTGGNFSTECVREPNEWVHINDVKQIKDINNKFGNRPLKKYPLCGMFKYRLFYRYFKGVRVLKPLDLIPYEKESVISELETRFGWQRYKNKHYESLFTRFYEGWWLIKKFGYDKRRAHFSSLVLTGQLSRDDALKILAEPPYDEQLAMQDLKHISQRMGISENEFLKIMSEENKTYKDYKSDFVLIQAAIGLARFFRIEKRNFR